LEGYRDVKELWRDTECACGEIDAEVDAEVDADVVMQG
jgi:hypothetical protein